MRKFLVRWWYAQDWQSQRTREAIMSFNGAPFEWMNFKRIGGMIVDTDNVSIYVHHALMALASQDAPYIRRPDACHEVEG